MRFEIVGKRSISWIKGSQPRGDISRLPVVRVPSLIRIRIRAICREERDDDSSGSQLQGYVNISPSSQGLTSSL